MFAYAQSSTNARRRSRTAVLGKLRELQAAGLADFAGIAANAGDMGEFPQLPKLGQGAPGQAIQIKMQVRRI